MERGGDAENRGMRTRAGSRNNCKRPRASLSTRYAGHPSVGIPLLLLPYPSMAAACNKYERTIDVRSRKDVYFPKSLCNDTMDSQPYGIMSDEMGTADSLYRCKTR